jgi:MFS transporter, DHA1 family, multidrug resistance protein
MTAVTAARPLKPLALSEFIPLMGLLTALDALCIDAMMPALSEMGRDLHVASPNDVQLIIAMMFLGITLGQAMAGPLSDAIGRKPAIYCGLALYLFGTVIAILSQTFPVMLAARVLQGTGAAMPGIVGTALVRDLYQGAPMARVMSFMGSVFIFVPVLAPLIGQGILLVGHWRWIFVMFFVLGFPASIWFALRQPETLPPERRTPLALKPFVAALTEILRNRSAIGYSLASGAILGAFFGYLNASQQIFQDTYKTGIYFAVYYSACAATIGLAMFFNGKLVERFGMHRLACLGCAGMLATSVLFLPVALAYGGVPPLTLWVLFLLPIFFFVGLLFGNLNAIIMEPLGHIAGMASSMTSAITLGISLPLGTALGRSYDGTISPIVAGFVLMTGAALAVMLWTERGWPAGPVAGQHVHG